MKILCLCPTYGRPPHILNHALQCFLSQDYQDKFLLIFDDLGNVQPQAGENWAVVSTSDRSPSLPEKYNVMAVLARQFGVQADAYAVWDDDDIYMPWHLTATAAALQGPPARPWSKPSYVRSTYLPPNCSAQTVLESGAGRFHGSMAISAEYFYHLGGYPLHPGCEYDQVWIGMCERRQPGDPLDHDDPSYIFRWADTQTSHCSTRAGRLDWYSGYLPSYTDRIGKLEPAYDKTALAVIREVQELKSPGQ